ncbi:glucose-6-phosphate isomerase, partial [Pseudomonadales bacterium]|nr:glucose-6-phosphate isomerase [Pseudomonadales bacterium]
MTYALPTGWQALTNHAQEMRQSSMMSMFEADPARATRYSMTAAGLTLDYSKNLINAKTLTLFQHLFDAIKLQPSIDAMIAGEPINRTENRAALHTLLRTSPGQVSPQLTDQYGAVQASLASVKRISDAVRSGQWLGATGKTITNILHLGIGGSYLGPRMVDEALSPYDDGQIRCDYVANVDGLHIDQVLARLDPTRTLVIIVSKSFSTVETRVNAESTQRWLRQAIP